MGAHSAFGEVVPGGQQKRSEQSQRRPARLPFGRGGDALTASGPTPPNPPEQRPRPTGNRRATCLHPTPAAPARLRRASPPPTRSVPHGIRSSRANPAARGPCPSDAGVLAAALAPADSEEREFRGLRRLPRGYRSMRDRARTGDLALKPADDAEPASLRSRRRLGHGKHLQEASGRKLLRISRPDAPRPDPPRYLTFFHTRMDRPSFPSK